MPDGYDTRISEENSALSAGEKQLITQAMAKMMEGRTSFMIAHRLYTIKNADKIIFMVDGDIKEVGSHDELLAKHGLYAAMYESGASMG